MGEATLEAAIDGIAASSTKHAAANTCETAAEANIPAVDRKSAELLEPDPARLEAAVEAVDYEIARRGPRVP